MSLFLLSFLFLNIYYYNLLVQWCMLGYSCATCVGPYSFARCAFFFIHGASRAVACLMTHSSMRLCMCASVKFRHSCFCFFPLDAKQHCGCRQRFGHRDEAIHCLCCFSFVPKPLSTSMELFPTEI
uniref:Uncharacterized protein n=1 Tax=Rhipicephalus zambeziensis TaxID=60191 RepID=A0A224Y7G6_9ACAR